MSAQVLIIEDNSASMDLMVYLLAAYGHRTLQADNGEQGVELARRAIPDLVICDIHLPRMDGHEVVRCLKADPLLQKIPVVAVTALAMVGDREKLLAEGFDAYISKPIDPEDFVEQVEKFLNPHQRSTGIRQAADEVHEDVFAARDTREARILVVDDLAVNSELIRSTLSPFGYELTLAASAREALALARASRYDLILSDLHMPGEDGFGLIRDVKADPKLSSIPFVFLSSSFGSVEDFQRGIALGASHFIRRPIEPQVLLAHIENCLNEQATRRADGHHPDR